MVDDERVFVESIFRTMRDYLDIPDNQPLILSATGKDNCETLTKLMMKLKKSCAISDYKSVIPSETTTPTNTNIMLYQLDTGDNHDNRFSRLLNALRNKAQPSKERMSLYEDTLPIANHPHFTIRYGEFSQYIDDIKAKSSQLCLLGHYFTVSEKDYPSDNSIAFLAYHTTTKLAESVSYEVIGGLQLANLKEIAKTLGIDFDDPNLGNHRFHATLRYNFKRAALDLEVSGHIYEFYSSGGYAGSTRILEHLADKDGNFDGKVFKRTDFPEKVIGANNAGKTITTIMRAEIYRKDLTTFIHTNLEDISIDSNAYLSETQLVAIKNSSHLKKTKKNK